MRHLIVGLAAAGVAALATASSAKAEEIPQAVKVVVVTCMLQSDAPRPFKVTDASSWNDYRFDGDEIVFFNEAAMVYYRAKCKAMTLALAASMQTK